MSKEEILNEISLMSFDDRKEIIQFAMKSLERDSNAEMKDAVEEMLVEYKTNKELTAFTSIDFDRFYEAK
ncbi:hypothetical protein QYS49_39510 [Marivirga salinae]|uniref:Uncharacterized protein n=1 Tax=Marivirga salinarum TaxID=3059078 RepID=A0AA51NAE5_9BACT|nr:hypothetical protein [Marivirga sp. BDSF4-3]WMN11752.1 hypothetical protein QYS49_39510 [Marivirga sp. BDSF4-3]